MNKLSPGSCKKINTSGAGFKLMENINAFNAAARKYGVPEEDIFQTVDLFEKRNIPQVLQGILALARTVR
jgi:muscular protein 20 (fragment)